MKTNRVIRACLVLLLPVLGQCCDGDYVKNLLSWPQYIHKFDCLKEKFVIYECVCAPKCPDYANFVEIATGTCVHQCPTNSVQNGTNCLSPSICLVRHQKVFNRSCIGRCPNEFHLEMAGVCYKSCPVNTVVKGSLCISHEDCTRNANIFNGTCIDQCPEQAHLIIKENKTCASTCPDKMVVLNRSCISDQECIKVHGLVIDESSCISNCSSHSYLHDGYCKPRCPSNTYINGSVCETGSKCIDKGNFLYNLSCIGKCPLEAPIKQNGYCVSWCSGLNVLEEDECIPEIVCRQLKKYILERTCVSSCPDTHPLIYNYICKSECPDNYLSILNICIPEIKCQDMQWLTYNKTCVQSCPDTHPFQYNSKCQTQCPDDTVSHLTICIAKIDCQRLSKFLNKGRCLDSCPDTDPLYEEFSCVSVCSAKYLQYNHKCIAELECTVAKQRLKFKGHCVETCPQHATFLRVDTRECFPKCPIDTVVNNKACENQTACTSNNQLIHNNTCVDSCPVDYPYNASWVCHEKCPHNTFPYHQLCRPKSVCINSGRYMHGGKCIGRCPFPEQFVYDGDCVVKCPNGTKRFGLFCRDKDCGDAFLLDYLFDGKECVLSYDCSKIKFEGGCIDYCPYEYFRYLDGCRTLPNILHPVSSVLALITMCIGTLVGILYEPGVFCKQRPKHLNQDLKPVHVNPCFDEPESII